MNIIIILADWAVCIVFGTFIWFEIFRPSKKYKAKKKNMNKSEKVVI